MDYQAPLIGKSESESEHTKCCFFWTMLVSIVAASMTLGFFLYTALYYNHSIEIFGTQFTCRPVEWDKFKHNYNSSAYHKYTWLDEAERKKIFYQNLRYIEIQNDNYRTGWSSFRVGMNPFGDMSLNEYKEKISCISTSWYGEDYYRRRNHFKGPNFHNLSSIVPSFVDWRNNNSVTSVKNQLQCGSWAFSAAGALEGLFAIKNKHLIPLSEQNLIDCSILHGNNGCNRGNMDNAFRNVMVKGGIDSEYSYPYEARNGYCDYQPSSSVGTISGYSSIPLGNETALKQAVAVGPVSAAIDAGHPSFQLYQSGLYYERNCSNRILNHGVLIVGYGTENGQDYWLVKNSWGRTWGMQGYIKMSRNRQNNCGIATMASYPIL